MYPPEEILNEILLPSLRALVARELSARGYSQSRISKLIGVSQARISMYLNSNPDSDMIRLSSIGLQKERAVHEAKILSDLILMNEQSAVEHIITLWHALLASGSVCPLHVRMYPQLKGCDICMKIYSKHAEGDAILREVERCSEILENSQFFPSIIPEVSANIARSKDDAKDVSQVAAIPGRIVRIGSIARASSKPEFGTSKHLSQILLEAKKKKNKINSVINIKFDRRVEEIIKRLSLRSIEIGGKYPEAEDKVAEAFKRKVSQFKGEFDVLIDRGGEGVEPNLYIFGKDAYEVTSVALRIAELYSKSLANL
jgi:predicted fused transcriptional regulator/phosphomethylpyrimidine kinase